MTGHILKALVILHDKNVMKCYEACFPPYSPHPSPTQQFHILPSEFSFLKHACSVACSCPTLWDPVDYSPPGSSVHGILQARIMEWAAISISRGSSQPRDRTRISGISCNGRWIFFFFFYYWEASKAQSISIFQQRILRSLQIRIP